MVANRDVSVKLYCDSDIKLCKFSHVSGQWERLASATGGSTSSADVQIINEMTGGSTGGRGRYK